MPEREEVERYWTERPEHFGKALTAAIDASCEEFVPPTTGKRRANARRAALARLEEDRKDG